MKKRISLLFVFIVAIALSITAEQLSPEQALTRLNSTTSSLTRSAALQINNKRPVYTASEGQENQFYIFNLDTDGFAIIAADDCVAPLLGYTLHGSFDADKIPTNLKGWLQSYQRQIDKAIESGVTYSSTAATRATTRNAISPMVTAKWDQDSPYNDQCPKDGTTLTYTGCVATAMAQVMYYYKSPTKGTGSNSYTWNKTTLTQDFSTVTFDWANMTPTYSSSSTDAAKKAVATLMYNCGIGVNMDYGTDSSGAYSINIPRALVNYFGYDNGTTYYLRDYYGKDEWETMVYNELAAGRPVIYDGVTSDESGHEFVCDGYNNGYFHINWGWSGYSDGYFLLTALDPDWQGIGGATSAFNYEQGAVMGIQPAKSGSKAKPMILADGDFTLSGNSTSFNRSNDVMTFSGDNYFYNLSPFTAVINFGIKLVNTSTNEVTYVQSNSNASLSLSMTADGSGTAYSSYNVKCSSLPASGTFTVTPAYKNVETGEWSDILVMLGYRSSYKMTIIGSKITMSEISYSSKITVSDISFKSDIYVNTNFLLSATASVTGSEYYGDITAALCKSGTTTLYAKASTSNLVDISGGESQTFEYLSTFPSTVAAGDYDFVFIDKSSNIVSTPIAVTVNAAVTGTAAISLTAFKVLNATGSDGKGFSTVPKDNIKLQLSVNCTSGYFASNLLIAIFKMQNNSTSGNANYDTSFYSPYIFIKSGETKDITFSYDFSDGDTGYRYFLMAYNGSTAYNKYQVPIMLTDPIAGIDDVTVNKFAVTPNPASDRITVSSEHPISSIEIYSIHGYLALKVDGASQTTTTVNISNLTPGNYILTAITDSGIKSAHIIKQ